MSSFWKKENSDKRFLYFLAATLLFFFLRYNSVIVPESSAIIEFIYILFWIGIVLLFIESLALKSLFMRISLSVGFGLVALTGFIFVFFSIANILDRATSNDKDLSFECIKKINYNSEKIKVYRTNGGASTAFGIIVRSERKIIPGLLLVNEFIHSYPMDTVGLEVTNNATLKILDCRKNNSLLKEINLDDCSYSFFTRWREFFD